MTRTSLVLGCLLATIGNSGCEKSCDELGRAWYDEVQRNGTACNSSDECTLVNAGLNACDGCCAMGGCDGVPVRIEAASSDRLRSLGSQWLERGCPRQHCDCWGPPSRPECSNGQCISNWWYLDAGAWEDAHRDAGAPEAAPGDAPAD